MKIFTADRFYQNSAGNTTGIISNGFPEKGISIFIGNLHMHAGITCIHGLFQRFGHVLSVNIPMDGHNNQSGGRGYIEMHRRTEGLKAIRGLHLLNFMNQFLEVKEIKAGKA